MLVLIVAACSSGASAEPPDGAEVFNGGDNAVSDASDNPPETTTTTADDEADGSDSIRDIDLGARLSGLEVALQGTIEIVDDDTIRMTFDSGSIAGGSPFRACVVAERGLDKGMTLTVVYPDGEKNCEFE